MPFENVPRPISQKYKDGVTSRFLAQPLNRLSSTSEPNFPGVYAIYTDTDFPLYAPLRLSETGEGPCLYAGQSGVAVRGRLYAARSQIEACCNLSVDNFFWRAMPVESPVTPLQIEGILLGAFMPYWNFELQVQARMAGKIGVLAGSLRKTTLGRKCIHAKRHNKTTHLTPEIFCKKSKS